MISSSGTSEPSRPKRGVLNKIKMAAGWQPSSSSDTGKGRSKTSSRTAHGFSLVKGKANHPMEDYHVAEFRLVDNKELGLFGIFDGHLGHDVPHYLQNNLFNTITNQHFIGFLCNNNGATDLNMHDNWSWQPEFWANPPAAILKAYEITDNAILQKAPDLGIGGSTAVTAILINDQRLLVANVGDSRAVLCRAGDAIQLSVDHEPKSEKRCIEDKGGFVTTLPGDVPRVDGQLAVARAFGDKNLKVHLRSDPDIHDMKLDETDEFLIVASDGLWKVMENRDAVNLVRKVEDPETAAKRLTEAALTRKSKDDISCIVVRFV